jgi:hypothetical protein
MAKVRGANVNYWLDLFTGTTWDEFRKAGAKTTGFREHNWKRAQGIKKGDIFLCYLVGVKRWVGLLRVTADRYRDTSPIWGEEVFPVRFQVEPVVMLAPENGVPIETLKNQLSFFTDETAGGRWSGWVRASPTKYKKEDGDVIARALEEAAKAPVSRPVDAKKLSRSSNLYKLKKKDHAAGDEEEAETVVSVPTDAEEDAEVVDASSATVGPTHTEIQWRLLHLGSQMGLNVWAPKNDRGRTYNGQPVGKVARLRSAADAVRRSDDEHDREYRRALVARERHRSGVRSRTLDVDLLWATADVRLADDAAEHRHQLVSGRTGFSF